MPEARKRTPRPSRIALRFLRERDPAPLSRGLSREDRLTEREKRNLHRLAGRFLKDQPDRNLLAFRDQFFSRHIMVDPHGRHFSDDHRDFMDKHRDRIDCSCIDHC